MTCFAHRSSGGDASRDELCLTASLTLVRLGVVTGPRLATSVSLGIQAVALAALRRAL